MKDIYELKANKYILKYKRLLQELAGGVKELPLTYLLRDIKHMITKIRDTDEIVYEQLRNQVSIILEKPMNESELEEIAIPFEKYIEGLCQALEDLINAFNDSELYSYKLPKFTKCFEFPDLTDLRELSELPKSSTNTDMLNVFLETITKINELNDQIIKNKYDYELQALDFNEKKSKKITKLKQFENLQIEREKFNPKIRTEEMEDQENFLERIDIKGVLRNFKQNENPYLIQIYHNAIIKKIKDLEIDDLIQIFKDDKNHDKDLIQIYYDNIIEKLKNLDKSKLESETLRVEYSQILKEKLDIFKEQEEKKYKYYNDIYKVFESITDLVEVQKELRYREYA